MVYAGGLNHLTYIGPEIACIIGGPEVLYTAS